MGYALTYRNARGRRLSSWSWSPTRQNNRWRDSIHCSWGRQPRVPHNLMLGMLDALVSFSSDSPLPVHHWHDIHHLSAGQYAARCITVRRSITYTFKATHYTLILQRGSPRTKAALVWEVSMPQDRYHLLQEISDLLIKLPLKSSCKNRHTWMAPKWLWSSPMNSM